ncbi:hypothetical protein E2C01_042739 [Portunus trituberculatus]|uniref:Uncharacterized protein n=1 Tax=Portunus trituberculatus TaxID=210409 RepID=A0A5B7FR09_PORTR|nr:hypothetical protein [Portunus trituberculatus]
MLVCRCRRRGPVLGMQGTCREGFEPVRLEILLTPKHTLFHCITCNRGVDEMNGGSSVSVARVKGTEKEYNRYGDGKRDEGKKCYIRRGSCLLLLFLLLPGDAPHWRSGSQCGSASEYLVDFPVHFIISADPRRDGPSKSLTNV